MGLKEPSFVPVHRDQAELSVLCLSMAHITSGQMHPPQASAVSLMISLKSKFISFLPSFLPSFLR